MAVFNSIALGKSSGSIGNVTTARLKGQGVAKSKITQTTNVNSPGQVESRGKMSNIVMAWQFLAIFLTSINPLRKSTESNYNAFVRGFKTEISDVIQSSRSMAAALLSGLSGLAGNFIAMLPMSGTAGVSEVNFNTGGLAFVDGTRVRLIVFDGVSGESAITDRLLTEAEWLAGNATVLSDLASGTNRGVYIYSATAKKCTNILFDVV